MSLVPSSGAPVDPYTELAHLIAECDGRPIHMLPRNPRIGGGTRLRFAINQASAGPIVRLCRRQGWRFTQPSGIQMVVDIPISVQQILDAGASRRPALEQGQRELPSG